MIYIQDDLTITFYPVRVAGELVSWPVPDELAPRLRELLPFARLVTVGEGDEKKVVDVQDDKTARAAFEAENDPTDDELLADKLDAVRRRRAPLLRAFDVYKGNVYYGVETETEGEKTEILAWYEAMLTLPENVTLEKEITWPETPAKIERYLQKRSVNYGRRNR